MSLGNIPSPRLTFSSQNQVDRVMINISYRSVINNFLQRLRSDSFWPIKYFSWIYYHWAGSNLIYGIIFSILMSSVHIGMAIHIFKYFISKSADYAQSSVLVFVSYCRLTVFTLVVPVAVIVWMIKGHRLILSVVSSTADVDDKLSKFGKCPDKNFTMIKSLFVILFPLVLIVGITWLDMNIGEAQAFGDVKFILLWLTRHHDAVVLFILCLFASSTLQIGQRYKAVNSVLKKISQDNCNHELAYSQQLISHWIITVRELRAVHRRLFFMVEKVSQAFGFQLLIITLFSTTLVIADLYNLYLDHTSYCGFPPKPTSAYLIWCFVHIGPLCTVAFCCSRTSAQEKYTAVLLQEMSVCDNGLRVEISTFTLQLIHYNVHFSACGFFDVNLSMLQIIITAIATYLVILIQAILQNSHH